MARARSYRTPTEAWDEDKDCETVPVKQIRLSVTQEALLRRAGATEGGETLIGDHEIRTADVLTDWGLAEQVRRRGENAIRITDRGQKWLGDAT